MELNSIACGAANQSRFLPGVLATRANRSDQNRPAAFAAICHGLAQHPAYHGTAAAAAARTGADTGALADFGKGLGSGLNRSDNGAFADFIAEASGLQIFNHRLLFGFLF